MQQHRQAGLDRRAKHVGVGRIAEIMVGADPGSELEPGQAQVAHVADLLDRSGRILQRNGTESQEAIRVIPDDSGQLLVMRATEVIGPIGLGPERQHHWQR